VREFPATAAGYSGLLGWLGGFGTVYLAGIEGTGSYGAGLARHVTAAGIRVVEVGRSDRQGRRRQGKSDPLDAVALVAGVCGVLEPHCRRSAIFAVGFHIGRALES
jgi:transposase